MNLPECMSGKPIGVDFLTESKWNYALTETLESCKSNSIDGILCEVAEHIVMNLDQKYGRCLPVTSCDVCPIGQISDWCDNEHTNEENIWFLEQIRIFNKDIITNPVDDSDMLEDVKKCRWW
jgi:hypothetical protein